MDNYNPMENLENSDIRIRNGSKEDLPAIYRLVVELAHYEKEPEAVTASMDDFIASYEEQEFFLTVAEEGDQVIGMALYYLAFSTWKGRMMYLEDFVVSQNYRKKGIGHMIFDHVIEESRRRQCILLKWQVLDWNEPAINFYKKYKAEFETEWWNGKMFL